MLKLIASQFTAIWRFTFGSAVFAILITFIIYVVGLFPSSSLYVKLSPLILFVVGHFLIAFYIIFIALIRIQKAFRYGKRIQLSRNCRLFVESETGRAITLIEIVIVNKSKCPIKILPEERIAFAIEDAPKGADIEMILKEAPRDQNLELEHSYEKIYDYQGYTLKRLVRCYQLTNDGLKRGEKVRYQLKLAIDENFRHWLSDKIDTEDFISIEPKDNPYLTSYQIDLPPGYRVNPNRLEVLKPDCDIIDRIETFRFKNLNKKMISESGSPISWKIINPISGFRYFCWYKIQKT